MNATIIENGEQLEVTESEARHLWKIRVIYKCRECQCYHINTSLRTETPLTMDDIEQELKDQKVEAFAKSIKPRRQKVTA